jgi:hypothetical protein
MRRMIFIPQISAPPMPVHVIVDRIPETQGLPIWLTTLISASIGTVFGILSGSLMEVLKPRIARALLTPTMKGQLIAELKRNLADIERIKTMDKGPGNVANIGLASELIKVIDQSRYRYYLEMEPLAVYEFDINNLLGLFYETFRTDFPQLLSKNSFGLDDVREIWTKIQTSDKFGQQALEELESAKA